MLSTIGSNVHDDNKKMYRTRPQSAKPSTRRRRFDKQQEVDNNSTTNNSIGASVKEHAMENIARQLNGIDTMEQKLQLENESLDLKTAIKPNNLNIKPTT